MKHTKDISYAFRVTELMKKIKKNIKKKSFLFLSLKKGSYKKQKNHTLYLLLKIKK